MQLRLFCAALLAFFARRCLCADILAILPFPQYSHVMPFMPILEELGKRGHNLTVISAFPQNPNPKGFTQIKVDLKVTDFKEVVKNATGKEPSVEKQHKGFGKAFFGMWAMCPFLGRLLLEKTKVVLPPPGTKFDLIIMEPFFCMEPLLATSVLYNAPIVATLPMTLSAAKAYALGNPVGSVYVPSIRSGVSHPMSFLDRVWNTVVDTVEISANYLVNFPNQDRLMREVFGMPDLPYVGDLLQNISLVLMENHFALSYQRPYLRNIVEVGGMSVNVVEPLPKDLENYMNAAKDGVIYFSWGSHFDAPDADLILDILMKTFSKLKQRVLFKWWQTEIPNKPENVLIQKWFPQPSILAHNKTVLFISHGGLNSIFEAAYHGVPVLGTPIFGDQPYNIQLLKSLGMALSVDVADIADGVSFPAVLNRMLSEPSFRENAKKRSTLLHDKPMELTEEATYWVEYVLRHGAVHLQPATRMMAWYSRAMIDVWAFILAALAVPVIFLCWTVCFCTRLCKRKPSTFVKPSTSKKPSTLKKKSKKE